MPISCYFQDYKALLVTGLTRVSSIIASKYWTLTHNCYISYSLYSLHSYGLITAHVCGCTLRSSTVPLLSVPFHKTAFSGRAFRCTAPTTWNSLPNIVTAADSLTSFKSRLKTHLFNQTFRPIPS